MIGGIRSLLEYILSVVRVFCLFLIALFIPRLFIHYVSSPAQNSEQVDAQSPALKLGLENLTDDFLKNLTPHGKKPYRVGLITNHTGKDQAGIRNIDILLNKGLNLKVIFTPKHGFNADKSDSQELAEGLAECTDASTKIPIVCWSSSVPKMAKNMKSIDVLFFDIQDSGIRHGYATTLLEVMKTVSYYRKKLVILDRPNLLGSCMEGSLSGTEQVSSLSLPLPIRHGMTLGELAVFFNKNILERAVMLCVIPMENYTRHAPMPGQVITKLSPNLSNVSACYGYSFLGLLGEIAPFDIGINSEHAFQCLLLPDALGLPKQTWYNLQELLKEHGVKSSFYRVFNERKKQPYSGLKIEVKNIDTFAAFSTMLAVVDFFKDSGIKLSFSKKFDALVGTTKVREFFGNVIDRKTLEEEVNANLVCFFTKAMSSFIYKPLPQVVRV